MLGKLIKKVINNRLQVHYIASNFLHSTLLLFLLPPSCMVAPIGNIVNKFFFPSTVNSSTTTNLPDFDFSLPTVFPENCTVMDLPKGFVSVYSFEVRGRTLSTEKNHSRDSSMSSTVSSVVYHKRQTINNGMDVDDEPTIESPALSYETKQENAIYLNKANENLGNMRPPYRNNETSSSKLERAGHIDQGKWQHQSAANMDNDNNVINIQLPYDLNVPTEPELWSGSFHLILLHGSIEQIASDTKSIKDSLNFMARYISNKKVNSGKANDLQNFNGMGDSIWNFISAVY